MGSAATTPSDFWLRAYRLTITLRAGGSIVLSSSDQEPNTLRFTFDAKMQVGTPLWWCDVAIYNLDQNTNFTAIQQGDSVLVEAGYQTGSHSMATIFSGRIFQPMWTRENVVDFKLTLQCFSGSAKNFVNVGYGRLQTQRDLVELICKSAYHPIQIAYLDPILSQTKLPRGGVLFGDPNKYFSNIARQYNLTTWVGPDGLHIADLGGLLTGEQLTPTHTAYAPPIPPGSNQKASADTDYSIIGTPRQTFEGVDFTVLLDPSLKIKYPPDVVHLNMSSTTIDLLPLPGPLGGGPGFIPPPDPNGNYIVAGLRHHGDTRGNSWYTEINGVTQRGLLLALGGGH